MKTFSFARRLAVAAVVTAVVASGTACSSSSTDTAGASSSAAATSFVAPRTIAAGKGSGVADGVFPRTVKHFQGETVLPAAPKRIVAIQTGQADALLTLGIVPAASASGEGAAMIPEYLQQKFPAQRAEMDAVISVGTRTSPNTEAIANVKPDLILMNSAGKDAKKLYETLSAIAPTVVTQGTGLNWKPDFLLLADAVGKRDEATKVLDTYQADAAALGASLKQRPTVSFLRRNGDRMRVFGVASFAGSVAEDAGLPRPAAQQFTNDTSIDISAEQLEKADGDRIFYAVQGGKNEALTGLALWPTLTGVTQGHAVAVDDDPFYLNAGPTAARIVLDTITPAVR